MKFPDDFTTENNFDIYTVVVFGNNTTQVPIFDVGAQKPSDVKMTLEVQ